MRFDRVAYTTAPRVGGADVTHRPNRVQVLLECKAVTLIQYILVRLTEEFL